jgi:hypothetical protein
MSKELTESLVDLGFTALEAEIYGALVQGEAQTGYRVAQLLGKPVANIYKALESLHAKGGIMVDETDKKLVRAVAPRELMRSVQREFDERRRRATDALARLPEPVADRRIYELGARTQVTERARAMLKQARSLALLDLGPEHARELGPDLERAAARGVSVSLRTENPIQLAGVDVVVIHSRGAAAAEPWAGSWLTLVVDGSEQLLAVFDASGVLRQGVYTASTFLSWVFHCGLAAEITLDAMLRAIERKASPADLRALVDEYMRLVPATAPGRRDLVKQLRESR